MKIHSDLKQCDFLPSFNNLRSHLLLYNFPFYKNLQFYNFPSVPYIVFEMNL